MSNLRSPLCNKPLTKNEFANARGILEARDKHLHGDLNDRIRQTKRGTTPQTEEPEFEDELTERLRASSRTIRLSRREKVATYSMWQCMAQEPGGEVEQISVAAGGHASVQKDTHKKVPGNRAKPGNRGYDNDVLHGLLLIRTRPGSTTVKVPRRRAHPASTLPQSLSRLWHGARGWETSLELRRLMNVRARKLIHQNRGLL